MCDTCGCSESSEIQISSPETHGEMHEHEHEGLKFMHTHGHSHDHHDQDKHSDRQNKTIELQTDILKKNNLLAERNRGFFDAKNIFAINLVSSPGSGKTTLLEKTIREYSSRSSIYVIEGDQQTQNDAERIKSAGAPVIQINTGNGCHLDSNMISKAMKTLDIKNDSILVIENVGNLVCPALFDLGESKRVVIISVTEGDDKPLKYPTMFQSSHLCVINKIDLLPYVDFSVEKTIEYASHINPNLQFIQLSAKSGDGVSDWYKWLSKNCINGAV